MVSILFTILGLAASILGFGILVFIHELGHFLAAKHSGVGVTEFSLGFGKKLWGFKRGETEYKISAIPLGGYVNMMGLESDSDDTEKSFNKKPKLVRLKILAAGVVFNLIFAVILMTGLNMCGTNHLKPIVKTLDGFPAAEVLVTGDEIKRVNGVEVFDWRGVSAELNKSCGDEPIRLTILSIYGMEKEIEIVPVKRESEDQFGAKTEKWMLGIAPIGETFLAPGLSPVKAFTKSIGTSGMAYALTYKAVYKLFVKEAKAEKVLGGPVLIFSLMTKSAKAGLYDYFYFLAILSLLLCIMNSMPIPILDGGHIMFLGIEAVRGKPLSDEKMEIIQKVFFFLLILLMAYVTFIDIGRFIP